MLIYTTEITESSFRLHPPAKSTVITFTVTENEMTGRASVGPHELCRRNTGRIYRVGAGAPHESGSAGSSKAVAELVRLGVVCHVPPPDGADRRAKLLQLTDIGWHGVTEARRAREHLERQLEKKLGTARYASIRVALRECLGLMGGVERIRNRQIRPPE